MKTNFFTLVRQKPKTPEQWATLTEVWFVACEYKPSVEDFRLLQNSCGRIKIELKLRLTADNFELNLLREGSDRHILER
jgi:hypothetical protein